MGLSSISSIFFLLLLPIHLCLVAAADNSTAKLQVYNASSTYIYQGCYNETTGLPNTAGLRALSDGTHTALDGTLTPELCLSYCHNGNNGTTYKYAGLEYSRECWCAQHLSSLSVKLDDAQCNTPCDGANGTACGGSLKLSLYLLVSGAERITITTGVLAAAALVASLNLL